MIGSLTFCLIGFALFSPLCAQSAPPPNILVRREYYIGGRRVPTPVAYGPASTVGGGIVTVVINDPAATAGGVPTAVAHGPASTVGGGVHSVVINDPAATAGGVPASTVGSDVHTVVANGPAATAGGVPTVVARGPPMVAPNPSIVLGNGTDLKDSLRYRSAIDGEVIGLILGGVGALIFGIGSIWSILRRKRKKANKVNEDIFEGEFQNGMGPKKFSLVQIAKMTSNFKGEKLGEGGFGAVFKGYLTDLDTNVAVKRISKASKQGIKEYASEVKIISRLRHKNLVKLVGWCHEKGELILVYEFMANGSLDSHLFKGKSLLTWDVRFKIMHGLASALLYLHEEGDHCVLHRDIKASNIMLDSSFNAKLGDFGLARLVDHAKGSQTTQLAGTMGYMAPECISSGKASKESDVYSLGVVALEIACGRRSIEPKYKESRASLVAWVWDLYGKQLLLNAADPKLSVEFDAREMECLLKVGLWCVHPDQNSRPSIRQAIRVLNFEAPSPKLPSTRPTPTYDVPMGCATQASEPCCSVVCITVPR
ncbi:L-type lectin-domain containing receptor kinase IX.1 [Hibiscus syriacus]|uniref:L-type lectin-domain containing receptor kinase IX.1 n=1 Tax=Hibiscus syriacus TaxID=106335 RepID=A0A6A2ZNJ8_HIBSY|nr:L-type lectin-domain containing receptor kinase IX.1-like [Hibiscus syriacus]KAE8692692.1 L-type lectin-domain containing receptor kinase IX.1 [Hibiscus syriacus]